jgi:hypothetical protein
VSLSFPRSKFVVVVETGVCRLHTRRPDLVSMVERQREKWPWTHGKRKFNASKTRADVLKEALLDPAFGFTTMASPPSMGVGNAENGGQRREGLDGGLDEGSSGTSPCTAILRTSLMQNASKCTADFWRCGIW